MRPTKFPTTGLETEARRLLAVARAHLDLDAVLLVVRDSDGTTVVRAGDGDLEALGVVPGTSSQLAARLFDLIAASPFPTAIPDIRGASNCLCVSDRRTVGAVVGAPLGTATGEQSGIVCGVALDPHPDLDHRDANLFRLIASALGELFSDQPAAEQIRDLLERGMVEVVFQPVFDLERHTVVCFEALARFPADGDRSTAEWFAAAERAGLGRALELAAVAAALERLDDLPAETTLAINVSPATAASADFFQLVSTTAGRLIIELTEHARVDDYEQLAAALDALRAEGARLAIDDVGAGFSSLRHILLLSPDIVKLDTSLVREIEQDSARQALASSLVAFGRGIGARVTAEGIESARELAELRELGVTYGQGYLLGRPESLPARVCGEVG